MTKKETEIVKPAKEIAISESEAKSKDKRMLENYKSWRVSYIEFAESVYDAYSSKIWTALGFNGFDAYCASRFANDNLGRTTVREAIRVWSQMRDQLKYQFSEEDKLVDETKRRLKKALEASGGKHSYVQELVRYDVAKDFDKAIVDLKAADDINDVKARLRKKFKPVNPGQVAGEASKRSPDNITSSSIAEKSETVNLTFQFQVAPTDDLSVVNKALETCSIELGTKTPASEMNAAQRGRLFASLAADYLGSSDVAAETMDDTAKREMAKMKFRDGVRQLLGIDPTDALLMQIYKAINSAIEKYMADADDGAVEEDTDDEVASHTVSVEALREEELEEDDESYDDEDFPEGQDGTEEEETE